MKAYCERVGIQYEEHMTKWKAGEVPKAWEDGLWGFSWRYPAIHSSGFLKSRGKSNDPDVTYPIDVMKAIDDNRPFYEKLYSVRVRLV